MRILKRFVQGYSGTIYAYDASYLCLVGVEICGGENDSRVSAPPCRSFHLQFGCANIGVFGKVRPGGSLIRSVQFQGACRHGNHTRCRRIPRKRDNSLMAKRVRSGANLKRSGELYLADIKINICLIAKDQSSIDNQLAERRRGGDIQDECFALGNDNFVTDW